MDAGVAANPLGTAREFDNEITLRSKSLKTRAILCGWVFGTILATGSSTQDLKRLAIRSRIRFSRQSAYLVDGLFQYACHRLRISIELPDEAIQLFSSRLRRAKTEVRLRMVESRFVVRRAPQARNRLRSLRELRRDSLRLKDCSLG